MLETILPARLTQPFGCFFLFAILVDYTEIDPILLSWLKPYGLRVFTRFRESEVRHIDVVDDAGDRYQISISEPSGAGNVLVFVGNYLRKKKQKRAEYSS